LLTSIVRLSKSTHLFLVPLGGDFIELVAPTEAGTTAGKLLEKRGDGGYMVIMQTEDAKTRREYLKKQGLAEVIFTHDDGDVVCTQYHPKGIKGKSTAFLVPSVLTMPGGMMPELDSHAAGPDNPTPLQTRFSPWHACGSEYSAYGPGMRRSEHLALLGCVLRLQPGDADYEGAARQWEELFGVARSRDLLAFTNAKLGFVPGRQGQPGGLVSITVGVYGKDKLHAINGRAKTAGVCAAGRIRMGGVDWNFTLTGHGEGKNRL
jgi:hypothetical protein